MNKFLCVCIRILGFLVQDFDLTIRKVCGKDLHILALITTEVMLRIYLFDVVTYVTVLLVLSWIRLTSSPVGLYTVTSHTTYVTASIVTGPTYVTASRPIVTCSTYVTASAATCTLCTSICISQCRDGSFSVGLCCSSISCPTLFNQCQFCLSISIHFGDFNEEDAEVDTASGATRWIIMEDATVLGLIIRGSESTRNGISSSADEWKDVRREMWVDKRKAWLMDEKRG